MKKALIVFLLLMSIVLSGCSIFRIGNSTGDSAMQKIGLEYSPGDYTITKAVCFGWVGSEQKDLVLSIPVPKNFSDNQNVIVSKINNATIRVAQGGYVQSYQADFTQFISEAYIRNDGSVLYIVLNNSDSWKTHKGQLITNETVVSGYLDIYFTVK